MVFLLQLPSAEEVNILGCFLFGDDVHCLPVASAWGGCALPANCISWDWQQRLTASSPGPQHQGAQERWKGHHIVPISVKSWGSLQAELLLWLTVHGGESSIPYAPSSPPFLKTIWHPVWQPSVLWVHKEKQWSELETGHQLHSFWPKLNYKEQLASWINLFTF